MAYCFKMCAFGRPGYASELVPPEGRSLVDHTHIERDLAYCFKMCAFGQPKFLLLYNLSLQTAGE